MLKAAATMRCNSTGEERTRISIVRMVDEYAKRGPYLLNPDSVIVKNIINGLTRNKVRHGYAYCPCREVTNIHEEDKNNICPCRTHKKDIARHGTCECGLFVNKEYFIARHGREE